MTRPLAPWLAAALLAGCAHASVAGDGDDATAAGAAPAAEAPAAPAPAPAPPAEMVRLHDDLEALLSAQALATWNAWTTGAPLDLAAAYRGREWIADGRALALAESTPPGPTREDAIRAAALRAFLLGETLSAAVQPAAGKRSGEPSFTFEGRKVLLRDAPSLLAGEASASRRAAIDAARAPAAMRRGRDADADADALAAAAARLGRGDLRAVAASLRGRPASDLAALAAAALDATGPAYCAMMEDLARRELGASYASTRLRDLPRMLRASHDAGAHPAARLVADGQAAAAALGTRLEGRVTVDDASRPRKSQRPLAVPVRVPADVRLSAMPSGGSREARAFLHELGVALYYSGVKATAVEDRRLGSAAIPATWGFLLEGLGADPAWLAERSARTGHALSREVRAAQAWRLHTVRWLAATLLREAERGTPAAEAGDVPYLSRALCRTVGAEEARRWPLPRDPLLQSAENLRAAILAGQLEAALNARAAQPWWRQPDVGPLLAGLWSRGSSLPPEEVARAAGLGSLDAAPLARTSRARFDAAGW